MIKTDVLNKVKHIDGMRTDISDIQNELQKSVNTKYTTVNGVKEFQSKDGYIDNIYIPGETLVNLALATITNEITELFWVKNESYRMFSSGIYTIQNFAYKPIYIEIKTLSEAFKRSFMLNPNEKQVFTLADDECVGSFAYKKENGWTSSLVNSNKNVITIIKGDHSNTQLTYFEGMKSVGQDVFNLISYNGENLFNKNTINYNKSINASNGEIINSFDNHVSDFIKLDNKTIIKYGTQYRGIYAYDLDKKYIGELLLLDGVPMTVSNNVTFIRIHIKSKGYQENQVLVLNGAPNISKIPWIGRSVPNGKKDEILQIGNKYYKIVRCKEIELTSSMFTYEGSQNSSDSGMYRTVMINNSLSNVASQLVYCDKIASTGTDWNSSSESIYTANHNGNQAFCLVISTSRVTGDNTNFNAIKNFLDTNKPIVVYELATPQVIEIPNPNIRALSPKSTVVLNSGIIQANCNFDITNSLFDTVNTLSNKVDSITNFITNENTHLLMPLNGWTKFYGSPNITKCGNIFNINIGIQSGVTASNTILFKISDPSFIPKNNQVILCGDDVTGDKIYAVVIRTNGTISIGSKNTFSNKVFISGSYSIE